MKSPILYSAFFLAASSVASLSASSTLLVHDTLSKPFSLSNEILPIEAVLKRFDTSVRTLVDSKVCVEDLKNADFIVLAGITGFPKLNPEVLKHLQTTPKPVIALGAAASFASLNSSGASKTPIALEKAKVSYRGRDWTLRLDPFYDVGSQGAGILARATSSKTSHALAWKAGNRFGFASLPGEAPLTMVFSDILLDFFGVEKTAPSSLVFVIQDYNPSCNPATLRRVADYFAHQKTPFVVTTQMKEVPIGVEVTPREEFLDALLYAQARGARIFLRGGNGPERSEVFRKEGIRIEGTEDTNFVKSGLEVGNACIQRIPGEPPVSLKSAVPLPLEEGGWLLPANVHAGMDGPANDALRESILDIASFRDGLAVVVVPAWMRFQDILSALQAARSTDLQVVDPVTRYPIPKI